MSLAARLLLAAGIALTAAVAFPASAKPAPAASPEPYFKHAEYGALKLSTSGKVLGAVVPVRGRLSLAVIDLGTNANRVVAGMDGRDIVSFDCVNDNRLVFSVADLQAGLGEQRGGGLFAVNRDSSEFRELVPTIRRQIGSGQFVLRGMRLHSVLRDGSDDVLLVSFATSRYSLDLYRLDTRTGRKSLKSAERPGDVVRWVVDRNGVARAAVTVERATKTRIFWRTGEDAKWLQLAEFGMRGERFTPIAFDGDGSLFVASDIGRDTTAIYRYDPEKKAFGEQMLAHPQADLTGGLVFDRRKNRVVGAEYDAERPGAAWFDEEWARLQKTVDASPPGRMNVVSRGDSGSRVLIYSYSDTDPGRYYLLDVDKKRLESVGAQRKAIDPAAMPTRQPVRYAARDGLEIPGYLTLPKGKEPKNLPLVLYVHGGPWVRGAHWHWRS
ncbi:MAG: hypothetical protein GZ089_05995 [Aromatoleum sp.]|nr:hypothetical protein [Aromatoleum sp.]